MVQFFEAKTHYKQIKTPGQYQFFLSNSSKIEILSDTQKETVIHDIQLKLKGFDKIIHSTYILGKLEKSWQRKMLQQQFEIANRLKAQYFVFHMQDSQILYQHLDTLISSNQLDLQSQKCHFALELTSRTIKDYKQYLQQLEKYTKQGASAVLDIAHVVSCGIYKMVPQTSKILKRKIQKESAKNQSYDANHNQLIKRVTKFVHKYGNQFDFLHFADQGVQADTGNDQHQLPFAQGQLFNFNNIFTSIDLLDELITQYSLMVIEFVDTNQLFRRAVTRYIDKKLYINKELITYYVQILRWHSDRLLNSDYEEYGRSYQVSVYESLAQQLIEICKQPDTQTIGIQSPLWIKYNIPHKIAQLLLVVELTSYFRLNKIIPPWEKGYHEVNDLQSLGHPRSIIDQYIKKFIKIKLITSAKQVYGSYLRGNIYIGDIDIIIDEKLKQKALANLAKYIQPQKALLMDQQTSVDKHYTIVKIYFDNQVNVDLYFTKMPNPVMELFLTGNKYFNIFMRNRAQRLGYKLTNTQLLQKLQKDVSDSVNDGYRHISVKTQADVFKRLEMRVVPPKFRVFLYDIHQQYVLS